MKSFRHGLPFKEGLAFRFQDETMNIFVISFSEIARESLSGPGFVDNVRFKGVG